jgi:hypothetical protein
MVVTPVKTGVQRIYTYAEKLDPGFRRDDEKRLFRTFYKIVNIGNLKESLKDKKGP